MSVNGGWDKQGGTDVQAWRFSVRAYVEYGDINILVEPYGSSKR